MEIWWQTAAFAAKVAVVVLAFLVMAGFVARLVSRGRPGAERLRVQPLHRKLARLAAAMHRATLGRRAFRRWAREQRKRQKREPESILYVLDFRGDIAATGVANLRHEVSAVLAVASPADRVMLRLESTGGMVHGYGLAASQLQRLREKKVPLTVCVDKVAASGGYMMACVADEIVAAPFAMIGSIGVVASVPNAHRLLGRHGVDYEEMTAGEFKRTVSFLGEISAEGRHKFQQQLEETHGLFKQFVKDHRPELDIEAVATGEYWFAIKARELGLVDRLQTSDDYLLSMLEQARIFQVSYEVPKSWRQRLGGAVSDTTQQLALRLATGARESELPRA